MWKKKAYRQLGKTDKLKMKINQFNFIILDRKYLKL